MATLSSGDAGFCEFVHHPIGVVVTWDSDRVITVDCKHEICGLADHCALYQKHPVGFIRTCPECPEHR